MNNDIYYPPEIQDQEMGSIPESGVNTVDKTFSTKEYRPVQDLDTRFPAKIVARETINQAIDTSTKKIKGEFTFGKSGSIKIGEYVPGVSGEILLTPNGLVAVNVNNEPTVIIDGTTGNSIFRGLVQAGSLIAGGNVVIENGSVGGRIVIYKSGTPSIIIGDPT